MITFFKHNFLAIFAIFFTLPLIALIYMILGSFGDTNYNYILENGIETTGYIIQDSEYSTITINNQKKYSIEFSFFDENGEEHFGKTSMTYSYQEVQIMEEAGTILIKYNPETFESIESSYNPNNATNFGYIAAYIILGVFSLIDIFLWVATIKQGRRNLIEAKVAEEGVDGTATIIDYSSNVRVNGVSKFKITYSWKNEYGETKSTTTSSIYNFRDVSYFKTLDCIDIKHMGNNSTIVTKVPLDYSVTLSQLDRRAFGRSNQNRHRVNSDEVLITKLDDTDTPNNIDRPTSKSTTRSKNSVSTTSTLCAYCGKPVSKDAKFCEHCGSRLDILQ